MVEVTKPLLLSEYGTHVEYEKKMNLLKNF